MRLRSIALCVVLSLAPAATFAQPLADRLPADTIVYLGWRGADSLGPQYDGSHLKAVLEASNVPELMDEFLPKLVEQFGKSDPNAQKVLAAASANGLMWRKPCAIAFTGLAANDDGGKPVPRLIFVCQAGADEIAAIQRQFEALRRQGAGGQNGARGPIRTLRSGDFVGITVGYENDDEALVAAGQQARSLAGNAGFKSALAKAGREPAVVAYVDVAAGLGQVNAALEKAGNAQISEMWPRVRDGLGLNGVKRFIFTQGFDGKDWGTQAFLEAPAPRKGLLTMLEAGPLSDDVARLIPSTATVAGASKFNADKFLEGVRTAVSSISTEPDAQEQFDAGLEQVSNMLGMDVRKDFLATLGDEWGYFTDPMTGGRGTMGLVIVNRLKDPARAEQAFGKLQNMAEGLIAEQTKGDKMRVAFREAKVNGVNVHYAAIPLVTPSWAVHGGNLYVGLYPQVVASAAAHASRGGKSLLDNKDFVALRQRLLAGRGAAGAGGGANARASSFQFMDLPRTAPGGYQTWLMLSSFARFADLAGVESPATLFPTMDVLMQHLAPAGSVTWADATGFHLRGVSPFPLSTVFGAETDGMMGMQSTALMASIMLPSLNRAREQANRVKSVSNLRQMGQAVMMHANENKGKYPNDIRDLLKQDLPVEVFINPRGDGDAPPEDAKAGDAAAAWVKENSDYEYVGAGKDFRADAGVIIAYEKPDEMRDGINVLFADGHVEFLPMPQAQAAIKAGRHGPPPARQRDPGGVF